MRLCACVRMCVVYTAFVYLYRGTSTSDSLSVHLIVLCTYLSRHSQSGTWVPTVDSSHLAQLQESLHDTKIDLERSHASRLLSERTCRQLEAQLNDSQQKYDGVFASKLKLENHKLDLELQVKCEEGEVHVLLQLGATTTFPFR